MADFTLIARRTLDEEDYKIFRYHFLLGADWKLCCRFLKLERGNFFHAVYRIENRLGRAFREVEPYGLYPLDEYFGAQIDGRPKVAVMPVRSERRARPLRPAVRKTA